MRRVVLDANILIAALMGSRGTITIITSGHYALYVPRRIFDEIHKHRDIICERLKQDATLFDEGFAALFAFITPLEYVKYESFMEKAINTMRHRDLKDADYLACALAVNADFIWTNDKDFTAQDLVPTKTTDQFIDVGR